MAERKKKPGKTPREPKRWTPKEIRALRERLGLTQTDAAEKVGVGQAVWAAWETGDRNPSRQSRLLLDLLKSEKI